MILAQEKGILIIKFYHRKFFVVQFYAVYYLYNQLQKIGPLTPTLLYINFRSNITREPNILNDIAMKSNHFQIHLFLNAWGYWFYRNTEIGGIHNSESSNQPNTSYFASFTCILEFEGTDTFENEVAKVTSPTYSIRNRPSRMSSFVSRP